MAVFVCYRQTNMYHNETELNWTTAGMQLCYNGIIVFSVLRQVKTIRAQVKLGLV